MTKPVPKAQQATRLPEWDQLFERSSRTAPIRDELKTVYLDIKRYSRDAKGNTIPFPALPDNLAEYYADQYQEIVYPQPGDQQQVARHETINRLKSIESHSRKLLLLLHKLEQPGIGELLSDENQYTPYNIPVPPSERREQGLWHTVDAISWLMQAAAAAQGNGIGRSDRGRNSNHKADLAADLALKHFEKITDTAASAYVPAPAFGALPEPTSYVEFLEAVFIALGIDASPARRATEAIARRDGAAAPT